jgi:uncharacterized protein
MTPQERQVLADLFERIRSAASSPRDAEAEAFIAEAVRAQPYAPYLLAQTALVQQHALDAAAQRIQELEAGAAQPAQEGGFLGNLGRSLFGGGQPAPRPNYDAGAYQRAAAPPPSPAAPAYAPPAGPWGAAPAAPRGGGFLSGALTAATGVAGGLLAANAIESLLGGGRGGLFGGGFGGSGFGGAGFGGGETVVNNFYESPNSGAGNIDTALPDAGGDSGFQNAADFDDGGFDNGGGFDDGNSGGGLDV